ncbi:hypothetical protein HanPI659440_Chr13g0499451 [Helianthus annuus]|nr:hypothetical protein HanPI659440_Chr13g0499451 [Helianthus annuus]
MAAYQNFWSDQRKRRISWWLKTGSWMDYWRFKLGQKWKSFMAGYSDGVGWQLFLAAARNELSGGSHWVIYYYIGLGWLYEKWTLNDLNKNNQFGRNLVFSKWCRGGLKWIWDGFKGIKMAVCCIFNVCSLLIQFYEENWWAVDYGICYNPDVSSKSGLRSNC